MRKYFAFKLVQCSGAPSSYGIPPTKFCSLKGDFEFDEFTLYITLHSMYKVFMYTIFNGVAYECRRLRSGLLLTVTATECLTRRSSVSPCEIILRLVLFVQISRTKRKVPHRVQTGWQRPTLYSAPPPQAALPQVANLEEMIGGHSCSHNFEQFFPTEDTPAPNP